MRTFSSLPQAEVCKCDGPAAFILPFFIFPSSRFVRVCKPRLESGYDCPEGLAAELNSWERPILLKPFRMSGCTMGKLETTIETNVSRQAHLEPVDAPSAPDYTAASVRLHTIICPWGVSPFGQKNLGTYADNRNGSDDSRCNDECRSRKEGHKGNLSLEVDLYRPKKREWDRQ